MPTSQPGENNQASADKKSKSQRKREMLALQKLGETLIELTNTELAEISMPDSLRDAVEEARRLTKRGALHRQKQYIGKLMRSVDVTPIHEALQARHGRQAMLTNQFHLAEAWRAQLIAGGENQLDQLLEAYPGADRHRLRAMLRDIHDQTTSGVASSKPAKALFRYLRELVES